MLKETFNETENTNDEHVKRSTETLIEKGTGYYSDSNPSETLYGKGTGIRNKGTRKHSDSNHEVCDGSERSLRKSSETLDGKGACIKTKGSSNHFDLNHHVYDGSGSGVKRSSETPVRNETGIRKRETRKYYVPKHEVCDGSESRVRRSSETLDRDGTNIRKKETRNYSVSNHDVFDGSESRVKRSSATFDGKRTNTRKRRSSNNSDSNLGTINKTKESSSHFDSDHEACGGSQSNVKRSLETRDRKGTSINKKETRKHSDSNHGVCDGNESRVRRYSETLDRKVTSSREKAPSARKKRTSNHSDSNHVVCDGSDKSVDWEELDVKIGGVRENPGISRSLNNHYSKTDISHPKTILFSDETSGSSFSSDVTLNDFILARNANIDESSTSESSSKGEQMDISHGISKSRGGEREKKRISRRDNSGSVRIDNRGIKPILIPDEALSSFPSPELSSNDYLQARKAKFVKPSTSKSASEDEDSDVSHESSQSMGSGRARKAKFAESPASSSASTDEESHVSRQSSIKSEPGNDFPVYASASLVYSLNRGHMGMSPTVVPPVQVMDRSPSTKYGSYRIPSSVFTGNTNPMEWTNDSDESLFSIQIGIPSLARDHLDASSESHRAKSGDLNMSSPQPSPLIDGRGSFRKSVEIEDSQTTGMPEEDVKLEERLDENENNLKHSHPAISYDYRDNGTGAQSSSLPIQKKQTRPKYKFCCLSCPSCSCWKCCLALCCCWRTSHVPPEVENQNSVGTDYPQVTSDSTCGSLCWCFSWFCCTCCSHSDSHRQQSYGKNSERTSSSSSHWCRWFNCFSGFCVEDSEKTSSSSSHCCSYFHCFSGCCKEDSEKTSSSSSHCYSCFRCSSGCCEEDSEKTSSSSSHCCSCFHCFSGCCEEDSEMSSSSSSHCCSCFHCLSGCCEEDSEMTSSSSSHCCSCFHCFSGSCCSWDTCCCCCCSETNSHSCRPPFLDKASEKISSSTSKCFQCSSWSCCLLEQNKYSDTQFPRPQSYDKASHKTSSSTSKCCSSFRCSWSCKSWWWCC